MREAWKRETYVRSQSFSSELAVKYLQVGRRKLKIQISPLLGEQDQSNALPQGQQRQSNPHPRTVKNNKNRYLAANKQFSTCSTLFYTFLCRCFTRLEGETSRNAFYGGNIVCVPVHLFFTATHFHLSGC